jgi:hypothetical protein
VTGHLHTPQVSRLRQDRPPTANHKPVPAADLGDRVDPHEWWAGTADTRPPGVTSTGVVYESPTFVVVEEMETVTA